MNNIEAKHIHFEIFDDKKQLVMKGKYAEDSDHGERSFIMSGFQYDVLVGEKYTNFAEKLSKGPLPLWCFCSSATEPTSINKENSSFYIPESIVNKSIDPNYIIDDFEKDMFQLNGNKKIDEYTLPFKLFTEKGQLLCSGEYYNTYFEDQNVDMWNDGVRNLRAAGPLKEDILKEMMPNAFAGNYILPQDEGFDLNRKEVSFVVSFVQLQEIVNGADPENVGYELKMISEIQKIAFNTNNNMNLSDAAAAVKPKQSSPQIQ